MSEPLWVYISYGIFTFVALVWVTAARTRVRGLQGGYGKGSWSENSIFMIDARENYGKARGFLFLILVLDGFLMYSELYNG